MSRMARRAPPDPLALRSPLAARLFVSLLRRKMARAFSAVRLADPDAVAGLRRAIVGRPLVVFCNHPAWWDVGLLATVLAHAAPERRLFAPFDRIALERYPFLRRCGAFGLDPDTASGARCLLQVGQRVLADPASVLCITPEGAFTDARTRPVVLRRGLAALLARTPGAVAVPVAVEYPFWTESRPEALARIGMPLDPCGAGDAGDADAWQRRLEAGLAGAMDALAADATARDPARFRTLVEGRAGVGGVYDGWRRLAAALAGERFDARHGAIARPPTPR